MHGQSAARELHGDGGGQSRLADAALAHQHHQAVTVRRYCVDQPRQAGRIECDRRVLARARRRRRRDEQLPQGVQADEIERPERDAITGQAASSAGSARNAACSRS